MNHSQIKGAAGCQSLTDKVRAQAGVHGAELKYDGMFISGSVGVLMRMYSKNESARKTAPAKAWTAALDWFDLTAAHRVRTLTMTGCLQPARATPTEYTAKITHTHTEQSHVLFMGFLPELDFHTQNFIYRKNCHIFIAIKHRKCQVYCHYSLHCRSRQK